MEYTINEIESLSFCEGVRKRISMYLGSADMQGVYNSIQEIISNSVDEFYMGFGREISISLYGNNKVEIEDNGRGIPFGIKEDGSNVLVDIFSRAHTGGKFNEKVYNSVGGLNGIGGKATCLSSVEFSVLTCRDGRSARAHFEKGILKDYKETNSMPLRTNGTRISFTPDPEVFNLEPIKIEFEVLKDRCKNLSYLTKGLTFQLSHYDESGKQLLNKQSYCAKNGLLDLIKDNVEMPVHQTPLYYESIEGNIKVEVAAQWTRKRELSFTFTNGLLNIEGGTSLTGLKESITRNLNKSFKSEYSGDMARTGLVYAVSCKVPNPSFANQTKTKINNPELRGAAGRAFTEALAQFSLGAPNEFKQIQEFLAKEQKAESAAQKARDAVINHQKEMSESLRKKVILVDKLKDAQHLGENATLLICEGDSALTSLLQGRDVTKYGIIPIRGKILNCLSNSMEDILENEEVKSIFMALGLIIGQPYNPKKLRYGKVGIAVDADDE